MKIFIVLISGLFCTAVQSIPTQSSYKTSSKVTDAKASTQTKRDLSLSYAATDIDSKKGTRVKTITVIKNLSDKNKNQPLAINPELHKNEEWATAFRDNFDSFGKLPDVPNIDELFDFMHKKNNKEKSDEKPVAPTVTTKKPLPSTSPKPKSNEKPVKEESTETSIEEGPVEKIKGDAEFLPGKNNKSSSHRSTTPKSQSLSLEKYQVQEPLININYSTPDHAVHQYFENYVQQSSKGYDYPKPCVHSDPQGSITVTTPAGRSYDIPISNNNNNIGGGKPYIAPAITKKTQVQQTPIQQNVNPPTYSINSLLPPQNQQSSAGAGVGSSTNAFPPVTTLQPPLGIGFSTTQRAYIAPSLRNSGLGNTFGPPAVNIYRGNVGSTSYRTNAFPIGGNRGNNGRSRGLKY